MTKEPEVYLPYPRDDELLYSVVARFCLYSGQRVHKLSCMLFGKSFMIFRADLPGSLASVAKRTGACWGMSGETILREMTLFPYYEPFLGEQGRETRKESLIAGQRCCVIGAKAYRVTPPTFLRFCVQCSEGDLLEYGETYWRRAHQLPGVLVCPEHETPLAQTTVRIQPSRTECIAASAATVSSSAISCNIKSQFVRSIARRCKDYLFGKESLWCGRFTPDAYREAALEKGVWKLPGIFSQKIFSEQFIDHYGAELLAALGICTTKGKLCWLPNIFQKNHKQVFHPLEHILIQLFLESLPKCCPAYPFGFGPWMCPNPHADHTEEFPIKKIAMRSRPNHTYYGRAQCSCGISFTTHKVEDSNQMMPLIDRVWSYGPSLYNHAQALLQAGSTVKEAADMLGVRLPQLKKVLDSGRSVREFSPHRIVESRQYWLELIKQDPQRRVTVARKKHYGLYQFLRKHDKEWLAKQTKPRHSRINLHQRDIEWSNLITRTAKRLGDGTPKTVIIKEAGLNLRIFSELNKMPLCASALHDVQALPFNIVKKEKSTKTRS